MLNKAIGKVFGIKAERGGVQELSVELGGRRCRAVNYTIFCGRLEPGDEVVLNTTAVDLGLGTGGVHLVIEARSTEHGAQSRDRNGPTADRRPFDRAQGKPPTGDLGQEPAARGPQPEEGHIIKLRYTPLQHSVLSVEEEASPYRKAIEGFESLGGMPVVVCELHSQLAAVCAVAKGCAESPARIAYIMTDTAALPAAFSKLVPTLKERGLLDFVITCGQAFGGDYEAVNLFSALAAAKAAFSADIIVVAQGPGNVGTGTEFGHGGVEVGVAANAVSSLGGEPIAALRISFADPRPRHFGVSHHSITALSKIALAPVVVPVPVLVGERNDELQHQISMTDWSGKGHRLQSVEIEPVLAAIGPHSDIMHTMGRDYGEDPEFFVASGCAGMVAARSLSGRQ
jgi:hypothetical protein